MRNKHVSLAGGVVNAPFILFHVVSYLTFRAIMSILTGLGFALWMGPRLIRRLQLLQIGQVVRNDGPESHF